jgi:hypothetical protein
MATVTVHGQRGPHAESFIRHYVFSLDHKMIARQYFFTTMFMALIAGSLAMVMRVQLGWPESGALDPQSYLAAVTMHGTIMIFFFLTSVLTGVFGNFLVPLMIGAGDMAFPLLNMLYWTFVPAVVVLLASFFTPGGPAGNGWVVYAPLSAVPQAAPGSGLGQTLWIVSLLILLTSALFGSLNVLTTVINVRTRGMSMWRLPLTMGALLHVGPGPADIPRAHGRARHAAARPGRRHELLCPFWPPGGRAGPLAPGRGAAPVAASVLVLWAPGGLHHYLDADGDRVGHPVHLYPQADLWLPGDGAVAHSHWLPQLPRLGAPHVRERDEPPARRRLRLVRKDKELSLAPLRASVPRLPPSARRAGARRLIDAGYGHSRMGVIQAVACLGRGRTTARTMAGL